MEWVGGGGGALLARVVSLPSVTSEELVVSGSDETLVQENTF